MKMGSKRVKLSAAIMAVIVMTGTIVAFADSSDGYSHGTGKMGASTRERVATNTPIQHVVVVFGENVSFDHYFATYPSAKNPLGEPPFYAAPNTPSVYGLTENLLTNNLNLANPQRLDRSQPITDDMDHDYTAEQKAFDGGLMDKFVQNTGAGDWPMPNQSPNVVMDYYDGNTVTGLWNYAQHFAISDSSFGTTFGPSTPGALNLISGQTHGAVGYSASSPASSAKQLQPDSSGTIIPGKLNKNGTLFSDADPYLDKTSKGQTIEMTGRNIGDLLNASGITWGWFEGGFKSGASHKNVAGQSYMDYIPHHEPFQYYQSTANPDHLPPTSVAMIGHQDEANHQYGLSDFWAAADSGNLPAVSFLKAPAYQDGHAGYSDPLDEQNFIVKTINHLESLPTWGSTAVFLAWDDSDGWYDHVMGPIVNQSNDPQADALDGPGNAGNSASGIYLDRAGYGPRLPLLAISPFAKHNYVANTVSDQSSVLRFIEDNWNLGRIGDQSYDAKAGSLDDMFDFSRGPVNSKLFLDPGNGEPIANVSAPFTKNGQLFIALSDMAQSLDVNVRQNLHEVWFTYGGHQVVIPLSGHEAKVDENIIHFPQNVATVKNALFVPVANLAAALRVKVIQYSNNSILFQPLS